MDEYWQRTVSLDSAFLDRGEREILVKVHEEEERSYRLDEIVPIERQSGTRVYFHARAFYPYAAPILRMAIAPPFSMDTLGPDPKHQESIGTLLHSEVMREDVFHREIGNAQGWVYEEEEKAILWECYLFEAFRTGGLQRTFWEAFERILAGHPVRAIYTLGKDPAFGDNEYRALLSEMGYQEEGKVWKKEKEKIRGYRTPKEGGAGHRQRL